MARTLLVLACYFGVLFWKNRWWSKKLVFWSWFVIRRDEVIQVIPPIFSLCERPSLEGWYCSWRWPASSPPVETLTVLPRIQHNVVYCHSSMSVTSFCIVQYVSVWLQLLLRPFVMYYVYKVESLCGLFCPKGPFFLLPEKSWVCSGAPMPGQCKWPATGQTTNHQWHARCEVVTPSGTWNARDSTSFFL